MGGCSILGCKSRTERKEYENVTFHSFPKDISLRKVWIEATGRQYWQPNKSSKICSIHFNIDAIGIVNKVKRINPEAIPVKLVHAPVVSSDQMEPMSVVPTTSSTVALSSQDCMRDQIQPSPDTERGQSILVKMEVQEDGPRAPQLHELLSPPSRPRGTRLPCAPMKVTSGPSPKFQVSQPPELSPAFMIAEIKSEAGEGPPSGDETLSCEPSQSDDNQATEDLVPLSAHPVPLSAAPDPLGDVRVKAEDEEGDVAGVKEEDRTGRVKPVEVIVDSETARAGQRAMDKLFQTHRYEQKIKKITRQREQLRIKVRSMRELIRRRDAKISKLQAQLQQLSSFVTQHHGHRRADELAAGSCGDAATGQVQSVKPNERKKKANRVLYVVKGADRPKSAIRHKSAQSTTHIRPKPSVQDDADILQQSLISVLDSSEIRQETLLAVKNTDAGKKSLESVIPQNSVSVNQKLDIRKNPSILIQPITDIPKKPPTGTKRKLIVVKAKSVAPKIGSKRKSDIRQNPSVVIHPKLDVRQKVKSDIPQTSVGLQRTSEIRQNGLVIQIDGMHSTVLQPKLVRLDDNNMDLG